LQRVQRAKKVNGLYMIASAKKWTDPITKMAGIKKKLPVS